MRGKHRAPRRRVPVLMPAAAAAVGLIAVAIGPAVAASASAQVPVSVLDRDTSSTVKQYIGDAYLYGGTTPDGFDCSGLTQYVYALFGYSIPRTAEAQFEYFRQIPQSEAWGGDLVFFHDTDGYVYHVGIYEGGSNMVSALDSYYGVKWTPVSWGGGYVTYGTISH